MGSGRASLGEGMSKRLRLGIFALCALVVTPAWSAPLDIDVQPKAGYSRIILEGSKPLSFDARIEHSVLVVSFNEAVDIDLQDLRQKTQSYVAMARMDRDKKVLRVALKMNLRLHTSAADNKIALDLMADRFVGMPPDIEPDLTEEDRAARAAAERLAADTTDPIEIRPIDVRIGQQEEFTRLSFDFPEIVTYSAELVNGLAKVTFQQAIDLDIVDLRVDPPNFITHAEKKIDGNTSTVSLRVKPDVGMRHFRDGATIIIDILQPEEQATPNSDAKSVAEHAKSEDNKTIAALNEIADVLNADEKEDAAPQESAPESVASSPQKSVAISESAFPTDAIPGEERDADTSNEMFAHDEITPPSKDTTESRFDNGIMKVGVAADQEHLALSFKWDETVPAGVFARGNSLWIVFDHADAVFDFSNIQDRHASYISDVSTDREAGATILRFEMPSAHAITAKHQENAWTVTLGAQGESRTIPLTFKRMKDREGQPIVSVPYAEASKVHWLDDPAVGDTLALVTSSAPVKGLVTPLDFIEFYGLASAQGLVLQAKSDDMNVQLINGDVRIGRQTGLTVSQVPDVQEVIEQAGIAKASEHGFMDFPNWQIGAPDEFSEVEQDLLQTLTQAEIAQDRDQANQVRLTTGRFYLSHGMASEAVGVLDLLEQNDETAILNPAFRALRGVAHHLQRRDDLAMTDLSQGALKDDVDAAMWRGVVALGLGQYTESYKAFQESSEAISRYSSQWRGYLYTKAAEAALHEQDFQRANNYLDAVPGDGVSNTVLAQTKYLQGQLFETLDKPGEALQYYQQAVQLGTPEQIARGTLAKTDLLHRVGQISDEDAIARLDVLRYQWRGDDLELSVLHKLAELYVAAGDYRRGLSMMQEVVDNYPKSKVADRIATSMIDIFKELYLKKAVDNMPPLQALALYYQFRNLTPVGREGDDMIRKLVDRLVAFDLLEQAAELLQHQVDERLDGMARSQVATRLAVIYLTDGKAERALQTLRNTRQTRLPKQLAYARRVLEGRALVELGRYDHALEVVEAFDTEEVEHLRADLYWRAQNWPYAAKMLEDQLGRRWQQKDTPLSDAERETVLRTALAYAFAEDEGGLERMRRSYGTLMANSSDADAFAIVTETLELRGIQFAQLASKIATTNTLDRFMTAYRDTFQVNDPVMN